MNDEALSFINDGHQQNTGETEQQQDTSQTDGHQQNTGETEQQQDTSQTDGHQQNTGETEQQQNANVTMLKDFQKELNQLKETDLNDCEKCISVIVAHAESLREKCFNSIANLKEAYEILNQFLKTDIQSLDGARVSAFFQEIETGTKAFNSDDEAFKNFNNVLNTIKAFDSQNIKTLNDFLSFNSKNTEQIEHLGQVLNNLRNVLSGDTENKESLEQVKEIVKNVSALKENDIKELSNFFKGEPFNNLSQLAKQKEENAFYNNLFISLKSLSSKESIININDILEKISKDDTISQLGNLGTQLGLFADEKTKGALQVFKDQIDAIKTDRFQALVQMVNGINVGNLQRVMDILTVAQKSQKEDVPLIQSVTDSFEAYENFLKQLIEVQKLTEEFKQVYSLQNADVSGNPAATDLIGAIKNSIKVLEDKAALEIEKSIGNIAIKKTEEIRNKLEKISSDINDDIKNKVEGISSVIQTFKENNSTQAAQKILNDLIEKINEFKNEFDEIQKLNIQEATCFLKKIYEQHSQVVSNHQKHSSRNIYIVFGLLGSILLAVLYLIVDLKTPIY